VVAWRGQYSNCDINIPDTQHDWSRGLTYNRREEREGRKERKGDPGYKWTGRGGKGMRGKGRGRKG